MAAITERGGRYLVRVRVKGFKPVAKTFIKRGDATAWGRKVESDMEGGRWVETATAVPTMGDALKQYRASVGAGLKGAATYAYWFDEMARAPMAARPINEVTPFDLSAWRDQQQASGLAAGTVVRKLGLLGGFFTWCHKERGWIKTNPLHSVRKPRVSDARDRVLSDDERRCLLGAAGSSRADWLADVLVVLLQSAMRRGELWGLQRGAVDFAQATAHLAETKNGSARDVPLCPDALAALRRLDAAACERGSDALVPVADPHAVSVAFRRTLARAQRQYLSDCAAAGGKPDAGFLADVRLHDLRHDAVTRWAETGALSLPELMAVSGHKTPRMLTRYVSLSASKLAGKLASLSATAAVQQQQAVR